MRGNDILGLILPNLNEELIPELADRRTTGSVPFGGKYRLIDFPLSNMVNSGINNVGVITKHNFSSLMDHLGSGKAWDLSKRRGGLTILPPYSSGINRFDTVIESIYSVIGYIEHATEEYVLLCGCDTVCNIDYSLVLASHIKNEADITLVYLYKELPDKYYDPIVLNLDENKRATEILIDPKIDGKCNYGINCILIKRKLLIELISDCMSKNKLNYKRHLLQSNVDELKIYGYEFTGYAATITSTLSYFYANMSLMDPIVRRELFNRMSPIYTKVRDDMPCKYGLLSSVKNSLVAQGCVIDGEVENSVIFKGVTIAKGAKVSNCIIMQDTTIHENSSLSYVICDKD
ncbi:MAG: glucose-1-phosphate adenylyltransferase subunit GlgD, partial [Bacillota bacterium]|nr:glucose-1-phosphate adenylyltransferase subunit GlgD [Bacillota bacterium]